ncbi:hypothetical protein [Vallitalea okinawensis]|uniref:hypothetical protein n=1 Tax=Vallitalea okinawensis TaxID=2078660 RepID=UPI001478E2F4|nr:hypothetical protein [Vallitalea okinawensis]
MDEVFLVYKDKHKFENMSKRECECPISTTRGFSGGFSLECGECLKIFESDEPVEIKLRVSRSNTDCNILVFVELENGECLEFEIPRNDIFASNEIIANTKQARKITVECKSDSLDGGTCFGSWTVFIILRGSETDRRCECPVESELFDNSSYVLNSGENQVMYQSDEPTEIFAIVNLFGNVEECLLTILVELENHKCLKFVIQASSSGSKAISLYSKNVLKITFECLASTICRGSWNNDLIYRGA